MKFSLNSNRDGHLTAALFVGATVMTAGFFTSSEAVQLAGAVVPVWELIASPDMDIPTRRVRGSFARRAWVTFWKPFARVVAHRSPLSHSLLWGLPCRAAYVLALPVAVLLLSGWTMMELWAIALQWWPVLLGMAIADAVHMAKDGYGIVNVIFGR